MISSSVLPSSRRMSSVCSAKRARVTARRRLVELHRVGHERAVVAVGVDDREEVAVRLQLRVGGELERVLRRRPRAFQRLQVLDPVRERLRRDRVGDVPPDLVGVGHQALGGLEALVLEEVLEAEVRAQVGEVAAGLEHHQRDEAAVGRAEAADRRVHRDVRRRRRAAAAAVASPVSSAVPSHSAIAHAPTLISDTSTTDGLTACARARRAPPRCRPPSSPRPSSRRTRRPAGR